MKHAFCKLTLTLLLFVCLPSAGLASKLLLTPSSVTLIEAPDVSEARLLLDFALPTLPEGDEVYYADLRLSLPSLGALQEFDIYEIGTDWVAGTISWEGPWGNAGGDIRGDRIDAWITDERTGNLIKFVITESIQRFMSQTSDNYGFLVTANKENTKLLETPMESVTLTVFTGPNLNPSSRSRVIK